MDPFRTSYRRFRSLERLSELESLSFWLKPSAPFLDGATIAFPQSMLKIMRLFLIISILAQFSAGPAYSAESIFANLYNNSTLSFGAPAPVGSIPEDGFRLFVWNVHKGTDFHLFPDFSYLTHQADLSLLQEATSEKDFVSNITSANPSFEWTLAKSFQQPDQSYTGVATGTRVKALRELVIVSNAKEPLTETPKTILISEFSIENSTETLLIANIHAINFVSLESFKSQIRQLLPELQKHQGPMAVAGDFNTWDPVRLYYIQKVFAPLGLSRIKIPNPNYFKFDHIFIRQMNVNYIFDFNHINSSDHAPLMVDLTFDLNKVRIYETNQ